MTTKRSTLLRLPTILTAGVLSTGLLLSACSDNDKTANSAEDTAAIAEGSSDEKRHRRNNRSHDSSKGVSIIYSWRYNSYKRFPCCR